MMKAENSGKTQLQEARIETHGSGAGVPTPESVERRAAEIARINGRSEEDVWESDRVRAMRELHNEDIELSSEDERSDLRAARDPAEALLDSGRETDVKGAADEQQIAEMAVKEGVREAEHERMLLGQGVTEQSSSPPAADR